MLCREYYRVRLSEFDREVFRVFVPAAHPLRKALGAIPWDDFSPVLGRYYSAEMGQPAINPVLMLKLEYLRYQCGHGSRAGFGQGSSADQGREPCDR